jgi:CBS domain-containing protein
MQLREIMTHDVQLADPAMTLRDAATLMRDGDFGILPVGENDRLVGTITDRDITVRAVALGKDPNQTAVRDAMSSGVRYCFDDQTVDDAAQVMADSQIRRLPVLNREKRLVGIVAIGDLATKSDYDGAISEAVSGVSEH